MKTYKELTVWQKSFALVIEIYRLTKLFPKEELFVLVSQMRRAAISIPSNIAEGYVRRTSKEFLQFIQIAFGSAAELETQLLLVKELKLASSSECEETLALLQEVQRMLNRLIVVLKQKTSR